MSEPPLPLTQAEQNEIISPLGAFDALVVAVSGGPDSMALLHFIAEWMREPALRRPQVVAVTVDHGLRPESANEARFVGGQAQALGIMHRTLRWVGPHPASGLQAAAREARYTLLHEVASEISGAIVTGHTADDQAETFIMRLARGSGVDGLAAIPVIGEVRRRTKEGFSVACPVVRPLLWVGRDRLIASLEARGVAYVSDPSNADTRFERVRVRQMLGQLEREGLTRDALVRSTRRLQRAQAALEMAVDALEADAVTCRLDVVFRIARASCLESPELGLRLLRRLLHKAGGKAPRAELSSIEALFDRIVSGEPFSSVTLGGCMVEADDGDGGVLRVFREPDRDGGLERTVVRPGRDALWDQRFHVSVAEAYEAAVEIGPLGDDAGAVAERFQVLSPWPIPRAAVRGLPAFREAGRIVAVPTLAALAEERGDCAAATALRGPLAPMSAPAAASKPVLSLVRVFGC